MHEFSQNDLCVFSGRWKGEKNWKGFSRCLNPVRCSDRAADEKKTAHCARHEVTSHGFTARELKVTNNSNFKVTFFSFGFDSWYKCHFYSWCSDFKFSSGLWNWTMILPWINSSHKTTNIRICSTIDFSWIICPFLASIQWFIVMIS